MNRRAFIVSAAAAGVAAHAQRGQAPNPANIPDAIKNLKPMTDGIVPISDDERRARIEKARGLMRDNKLNAIVMEGGSSLFYFTGTRWTQSDRLTAAILPLKGEITWIVPLTDERAQGAIHLGGDVRSYAADADPYKQLANALRDRGAGSGRVGIEERVRFGVYEGVHQASPSIEFASADPVSIGCRVIKSPAELALMQRANDITLAAYRAAYDTLHEGMTQGELRNNISAAYRALGAPGAAMVSFGKYTAFPHGSIEEQTLKPGDFVLIDDGCTVEGYQSDITRTFIFGKPTQRQKDVWALERKAQDAALAAAKPGATCESVDAAARKVITDAGFGPGYKVPGLPHRTGHGIGLDGHEWTYLVKGNKTPLRPGMCFSDEPMIAIYGEFGVRLEDCMYVTENGARTFTKQSVAIDQPFA
jgi:Xaa-Pro dipeptidase